ncbi:Uncharacterised protein [Chryseobacterium nakagawai]|uniref:Uncharacterized protein n=1 Tax=Chryseobacterium nakagawai TaxID=1241982 RepID=A0AAD0YQ47_CHRNA|nr:hypothetical protein [Chryseobacterium nakagawai]AZA93025.1 hypothetical protein EG343_21690 [Chryseobacterium nakagawai]VEH19657.1 Uncharacterised protein [Chryseobacterium nakagawai]
MDKRFYITSLRKEENTFSKTEYMVLELRLKQGDGEWIPESKLVLPMDDELFNFFRGVFHDEASFILNLEDIPSMINSVC